MSTREHQRERLPLRRVSSPAPAARRRAGPVQALWAMYGLVAVATIVTYWRLPRGAAYHFADSGVSGAVSRTVVYLNFPVAIAAIALVWSVCRKRRALVITALCAVTVLPGVVNMSDLTAGWANVPAAVGVAIAVPATLLAPRRVWQPLSRLRVVLLGALLVWSVPWVIATVGLYAEDMPLLGRILMSREPTPGKTSLAAVHLGLHDGMFGAMLAATALVLSSRRLPRSLSLYLSLLFVYGVAAAAQDGWSEQFVKRGWSGTDLPDILRPSIGLPWLVLLLAALAVHLVWFHPGPDRTDR